MALREHQIKDIIATALTKAWEDDSFKDQLLAAPQDAIKRLTGERFHFNEGFTIPAFESSSSQFFDFDAYVYDFEANMELSEEKLDFVYGGAEFQCNSTEDFINFLRLYL